LIAERGIEGLSLRTLARRLDATTGLVSHHFLDRAELVEAALDHGTAVILARVYAVGARADAFDLVAAVLPTDQTTIEHWRFAFAIRTGALFDDTLRRFDETILDQWESRLPDRLAGRVDGDPLEAARHLAALVDGVALHAVLDPATWTTERQLAQLRAGFAAFGYRA